MKELLVNERGYFWWAQTLVPDGAFAPEDFLAGALKIDDQGSIRLSLDGVLPRPTSRLAAVFQADFTESSIFGLLRDGRHVRLDEINQDGGQVSSNAPSAESFLAQTAILARHRFSALRPIIVAELEMNLSEYGQWFGRGGIDYKESRGRVNVRYTRPPLKEWTSSAARLTLERGVRRPASNRVVSKLELEEFAYLRYKPQQSFQLDQALKTARRFEELVILLTDCERGLPFPRGKLRSLGWVDIYYSRFRRSEITPHWADMWTVYPRLEEDLGQIVNSWLAEHERLGPGFHLYLGNRRTLQLYPEHRFASFVWGLEALHRGFVPIKANEHLKEKIERIVNQITKSSDRRWLQYTLSSRAEPALADRLYELFSPLPISFTQDGLRNFCKQCADRRNDLSHFGGGRPGASYEEFLIHLVKLTQALDILYHARILQVISVPDSVIQWVFSQSVRAQRHLQILAAAGLQTRDLKVAGDTKETAEISEA